MEKQRVEYIDLTPTWSEILPTLLLIYTDATTKGREGALKELQRMASIADAYVAAQKADFATHQLKEGESE